MGTRSPAGFFKTYSGIGLLRLGRDLIYTRLAFPGARLVRWPMYMRGAPFIRIGRHLTTGTGVRLDAFAQQGQKGPILIIGTDVQLNDNVHIAATERVTIGNSVLIASRVVILDHNHGIYSDSGEHSSPELPPEQRVVASRPVHIEDNVWIGEGAAVLPGVTIGRGAIIGALAVVNRDVPPLCIAVGNPARVVKRYDPESRQWLKV